MKKSFTLAELLIIISLIAIIATFGTLSLYSYWHSKTLEGTAKKIAIYLEFAKTKSIVQENKSSWGVHFENPTSSRSFFSLFYNTYSTSTIRETIYLPKEIDFSDPSEGNFKEITFEKITGKLPTSFQIKIHFTSSPSEEKTIEVNTFGRVDIK